MDLAKHQNPTQTQVAKAVMSWPVQPFARGAADCCAFADHVVKELTGNSYIPEYSNDWEMGELLERHKGLSNAVSHWMGQEPVEPEELTPGDVVFVIVLDHEAIGILMDDNGVATLLEDGVLRVVRGDFIEHGWKTWV